MLGTRSSAAVGFIWTRRESFAETSAGRRVGALIALSALGCLSVVVLTAHRHPLWFGAGRLAWSVSVLTAVIFIARGVNLGRPVSAGHVWLATALMTVGVVAHVLRFDLFGDLLIVVSGWSSMRPTGAPAQPDELPRVWRLVNATVGDPVAPFAMHTLKSYHFAADATAAIAYRTRMGFAVVSGDPIGDPAQFHELVNDFAGMCRAQGWRILVLGCSQRQLGLWCDAAMLGQVLTPIPFGRDVVIDVAAFEMVGRRYRNLRQALRRTHNVGITTEVVAEQDLDDETLAELRQVIAQSHKGSRTERGFSMILDGALEHRYPGILLNIARDRCGRVQAFHRYATAGDGRDISLDVPWRRRDAPNGIDERLSVDMIAWSKQHGAQRLSLAFAAFPELFDDEDRSHVHSFFYAAVHLGDPLIALESLYNYLRKYHSLADHRYALVSMRQIVPALFVLLSLEFSPRRRAHARPAHAESSRPERPADRSMSAVGNARTGKTADGVRPRAQLPTKHEDLVFDRAVTGSLRGDDARVRPAITETVPRAWRDRRTAAQEGTP